MNLNMSQVCYPKKHNIMNIMQSREFQVLLDTVIPGGANEIFKKSLKNAKISLLPV